VDGSIRLDLGAGHVRQPGWISVDTVTERKTVFDGKQEHGSKTLTPEVSADLMALPFPDNYADEARAIHVIEHFYPWEAEPLLKEWFRVLKPGTQLAIECPCLEKVIALAQVPQCPPNLTYWALYGDPRYKEPAMMHRWCYGQTQLLKLMAQAGFINLRHEPPLFHIALRDQRVVGEKPEAEQLIEIAQ